LGESLRRQNGSGSITPSQDSESDESASYQRESLLTSVAREERKHAEQVLEACGGDEEKASDAMVISLDELQRRLRGEPGDL